MKDARKEEEAPELELKSLLEELKYAYLGEEQTYPKVIRYKNYLSYLW